MKRFSAIITLFAAIHSLGAVEKMPELYFNPPPREIRLSRETTALIANGRCDLEIVVPQEAGGTAKYAGEELRDFLQKSCGVKIPLLNRRASAKYAVILGDNELFRKAYPELDPATFVQDGFYILRKNNDIYIAGRDDKGRKMQDFLQTTSGTWWNMSYFDRGTLFGVYDFLERFAGIRFFFDGEIGTVVPKLAELKVPASIHIMERPDFTSRKTSWYVGRNNKDEWYDDRDPVFASNRNYLRWRLETRSIPNCHGIAQMGYKHRFTKSHPEFYAMRENGKREPGDGQLCFTNKALRDEIYQDVRSFLRHENAGIRGVSLDGKNFYWPSPGFQPGFANVMPQDGFYKCRCAECRKYFDKGDNAGSNLIWEMTAELAKRAAADKLPGYLTQMGYHFYSMIPDVEIPDNVLIMIATAGPWRDGKQNQEKDDKLIQGWTKKINRKVAFWNYCINNSKWGENYGIPGMPHTTPRVIGNYYQRHKDLYYGGFFECETDHFIWGVPNIYVATKMFWNAGQDVDALLNDFYNKLFGDAMPEMKRFFEIIEKKWMENRQEVDTPLGPQRIPLSQYSLWTKIYPPEEIKHLIALFDSAEQKVKQDTDSLKRVRFFRKHFLDVMIRHSADYRKQQNSSSEIQLQAAKRTKTPALDKEIRIPGKTAYLRALKKTRTDLSLQAVAQKDDGNLYFLLRFEEPELEKLKVSDLEKAKKNIWSDALAEIFLNPSGDHKTYYQIAVHPSGHFEVIAYPSRKPLKTAIAVRTHIGKNFWSAEITVPLKEFGKMQQEFPLNFGYNRQLRDEPAYSRTYSWSPYITANFHEIDKFGTLSLTDDRQEKNLVQNWNFDVALENDRMGAWVTRYPLDPDFSGAIEPDPTCFISGGQSLHLRMDAGKGVAASQNIMLKPDTSYSFSYWIKHNIDPTSGVNAVVNVGRNIFMPELQLRGNADWHKKSFTFRTQKEFNGNTQIRFLILRPKAEIWIDNVRIEEKK